MKDGLKLRTEVKLSKNFLQALEQINKHLEYWPDRVINRCKQRLTKMRQMLIRCFDWVVASIHLTWKAWIKMQQTMTKLIHMFIERERERGGKKVGAKIYSTKKNQKLLVNQSIKRAGDKAWYLHLTEVVVIVPYMYHSRARERCCSQDAKAGSEGWPQARAHQEED